MSLHVSNSIVLEDAKHFSTILFSNQSGSAGSKETESNFPFLPLHLQGNHDILRIYDSYHCLYISGMLWMINNLS